MPPKRTLESVLLQAREIHDNFYLYPNTVLKSMREKIEVECPIHGAFFVRADHHVRGIRCRECNEGNSLGIFNLTNAENHKEQWLKINSWLYFLEILSPEETFFKVGVTTHSDMRNRVKELPKNYDIKVLCKFEDNLYHNTVSESIIKEEFSTFKYIPIKYFRGKEECFSENPLDHYYNINQNF